MDTESNLSTWVLCVALLTGPIAGSGAEPQRLTTDGRQKSGPVFRDGGREVVYAEFTDAKLFQLRRLVVATRQVEPLHPESTHSEFDPAWSADGETYAHLNLRGTLSIGLLVRDRQGKILHEILPGGGFCGYRSPALAPDHSRLVFSYAETGTQQIYSCKLNGEDRVVLAESPGISNWPSFSPDGRSIVFGSSRDGNFEIYRMQSDGTHVRRLTTSPGQDVRPKFSPDGKRIAFTSHRDGNAEIYVMDADGGQVSPGRANQQQVHRVTDNADRDDYPEWHPDGRQLVIVGEREGQHDLFLLEP